MTWRARPKDPRIPRKSKEVKGFRERFELLFAKTAVTLLDRQRERIEGRPVAVVDIEGSGFAVPGNHQKQERALGEIEPAHQPGFRFVGKADDGFVLIEPLQTEILQAQDGVNANFRHFFFSLWLIESISYETRSGGTPLRVRVFWSWEGKSGNGESSI